MGIIIPIFLMICAYLLGSIPWALIISKTFFGIDIREYGSKNMGATNTMRILGTKYGLLVFFLDALKASLIIIIFKIGLLDYRLDWMILKIHPLCYGIISLIGHKFPLFASFRGGKGVSCCAGIVLAYSPLVFLCAFLTFLITLKLFNYISVSSLSAATITLVLSLIPINGSFDIVFIIFTTVATLFLYISHFSNIKRLIKHQENKTYLLNPHLKDKNK